MLPPGFSAERARRLLCELGIALREALVAARRQGTGRLSRVAARTAADVIYGIDKVSEETILAWFERHWPGTWPIEIVMEGIEDGESLTFPRGTPADRTALKCILDPIDGTRNLMYDKRPAWGLAGLAPQRGAKNTLRDIFVAVMTELPTSKQGVAEQWSAVKGKGVRGGTPRPSQARDCRHGFASIVKFFPAGKELTARIEERMWTELYGDGEGGTPVVFEDQYTTTGGQLYEILAGHDRMIGDLRPLVHAKLGLKTALECHPYDICTELILKEAGGIVEDPFGGPVRAPLDTTTGVAWVGYANERLARHIRPVLRRALRAEGMKSGRMPLPRRTR